MNENVLVVPAAGIAPFLSGKFTSAGLERCLDYILSSHSFLNRASAEEDPSYKQIIPYVAVRHQANYLLTQRTKRQTESRLHGKFSLGIGGHINDEETASSDHNIIRAGLERELQEEIHILGPRLALNLAGIISDDTTPVGQVHLGLVFVLETGSPSFTVNEPDLMTARWAGLDFLQECFPRMETWSQILLEHVLLPLGSSPSPAASDAPPISIQPV